MPENLQMNLVNNVYINGKEVYNIYDSNGSYRLLWPETERPITPTIVDLTNYIDIVNCTGITVENVSEENHTWHMKFDNPLVTIKVKDTTYFPSGKTGVVLTKWEYLGGNVTFTNWISSASLPMAAGSYELNKIRLNCEDEWSMPISGIFYSGVREDPFSSSYTTVSIDSYFITLYGYFT